jgi:hypothetical protein
LTPRHDPHGLTAPGRLRVALGILALLLVVLDSPRPARFGYIDPGFGAMMVQLLTASFFGVLFYFKGLRRYLSRLVARLRGRVID